MGIEQLKLAVAAVVDVLNVLSKVIHKGGLFALIGIMKPVNVLLALDLEALKKEVADVDGVERQALEDIVKANLDLVNKDVQAKILASVSVVDDCVEIVADGVLVVKRGIEQIAKIRIILGV